MPARDVAVVAESGDAADLDEGEPAAWAVRMNRTRLMVVSS